MIAPHSVEKVWIPTQFARFGDAPTTRTNLAGCENCQTSSRALKALEHIDSRLLTDHWESQDGALREQLATLLLVEPAQIFLTSGAMSAIRYVFEICVREGTRVGLLQPDFPGFRHFAQRARADTVWRRNATFPFTFRATDIASLIRSEHIALMTFSNPNAALGTRMKSADIESMVATLQNTLFVVDEADAIDTDSVSSLTMRYDNIIVIRSFSKFYGISGLRVGYIVTSARFAEHFDRMIDPIELTSIAIIAAREALADVAFQKETQERVQKSRKILENACAGTPYVLVPGSTCFATYLWSKDGEDPSRLLKAHKVDILEGSAFGLTRGGRINLSDPKKIGVAAKIIRKDVKR